MSTLLKIAVAEPSLILRSGILSVLKRMPGFNIYLIEVDEIAQLPAALSHQRPDILIINPAFSGAFSLSKIKTDTGCRHLRCVALQNSLADSSTLQAYDETISIYDTAEHIREKLTRLLPGRDNPSEHRKALTTRECEIVVCVVKGLTNKQIADQLCLSPHTVITHRRNIAAKLQIHSPAGLTIYAIVNKLIELDEIKDTI